MRSRSARTVAAFGLAFLLGCQRQEPPPLPGTAGPAPLRRLSDSEYLNALHDLFPGPQLVLPRLPGEAVVAGFENAAEAQQPSDVRTARYETIANLYAEAVTADPSALRGLVGCASWATPSEASACGLRFVEEAGRRLFRRPLDPGERDRFDGQLTTWRTAGGFVSAVRLTLSAMLQSPQFLYRVELAPPGSAPRAAVPLDGYAMAQRLSFLLWESVPDEALLQAAGRDELRTREQLRAQAARMLADPRARRALWSFHRQWLGLDRILSDEHLARTPQVDAGWSQATQASSWVESKLLVENLLMSGGTLADLLTSRRAWIDDQMARLYGVPRPGPEAQWSEVALPEARRAGILTRAAFLAGFSHRGGTSPPLRGNGIRLRLLCQLTGQPPPDADLSMPTPEVGEGPQSNRTLFERRTSPSACQGCHRALDGLGFGFESYNAAGRYQSTDNGLAVNATGELVGTDVDGPFADALELSRALSRSRAVYLCSVRQWVRYALGRAPAEGEAETVDALTGRFFSSGGDVRELLMDLVTMPSFVARQLEDG